MIKISTILKRIKVKKHLHELFKDGDEIYNAIDASTEEGKEKRANCEYMRGNYILSLKNIFFLCDVNF